MPLHPQTQALTDLFNSFGAPPLKDSSVEAARGRGAAVPQITGAGPEIAEVRDLTIPGPGGDIPARLYRPAGATATIVYFHGGGWVVGDIESFDAFCRMLAAESGATVLSVEYRLAPEHPYPAPVEDGWAALTWAAQNLADGPLVVAGDSAGATIAAVCAVWARDRGGPELALQVLVYPVTDHDFDTASYREHGNAGLFLGRDDMVWFWDHYAPNPVVRNEPAASPLRTADLTGVAPTYLAVAEYDPLRDEGLAYARKLSSAGVPVAVRHYADQSHSFMMFVNYLSGADEGVRDTAAAIRSAIGADAAIPG